MDPDPHRDSGFMFKIFCFNTIVAVQLLTTSICIKKVDALSYI